MKGIIDRFEGDYAVVEMSDMKMINIERHKIPVDAKEGDVLILGEVISIDENETIQRKKRIQEMIKDIWN